MHIKDTDGVTLDDLVAMLPSSKAAKQLNALLAEIEKLRVQLAGCGVAAMCNTEQSREQQKCVEGDYGWSQSYQDVVNAVGREIKLRDTLNDLLAVCKEVAGEAGRYWLDAQLRLGEAIDAAEKAISP